MTAADRLNEIVARRRGMAFVSPREISDPLTRALYWKRIRWEAFAVLDGYWHGWHGCDEPEALDAEDDYYRAAREHRRIIQLMWDAWLLNRPAFAARVLARGAA